MFNYKTYPIWEKNAQHTALAFAYKTNRYIVKPDQAVDYYYSGSSTLLDHASYFAFTFVYNGKSCGVFITTNYNSTQVRESANQS